MTTITFDTLKYAKKLKQAGFSEEQAEAQASALAEAVSEIDVATKRDIDNLKNELQKLELRLTLKMGALITAGIGIVAALQKIL
ncbi:MAG: CCDC90 family protein [Rhodocyclaceae bacterium]|nr:CCDC90 family protein [Rhodocyclaceae bacterium]